MSGWSNTIAIAGIHTGIGKTIASAAIAEAMGAHYWKPVQAGVQERDADTVRGLLARGDERVHPEAVVLQMAASPHEAAAAEGITIDHTVFARPHTDKMLLVETAGGVLSPMSDTATMADFIAHYHMPVILVSQNYLGSINHTLLSIEVLRRRGIELLGVVINGGQNKESEAYITRYSKARILAHVPQMQPPTAAAVERWAAWHRGAFSAYL